MKSTEPKSAKPTSPRAVRQKSVPPPKNWKSLQRENVFSAERLSESVMRGGVMRTAEMIGSLTKRLPDIQSEGVKHDTGKPPVGLIPYHALIEEARVLGYGAMKYDKHNWRKGMAYSRLIDAAYRHIMAFNNGEDRDPESGLLHLAHARCCLGFLIEYYEAGLGTDDRYKGENSDGV